MRGSVASHASARLMAALSTAELATEHDVDDGDPQARVDRDGELLDEACAGTLRLPLLRVWTNGLCVVATAAQARSSRFAAAAAAMAEHGWPIVVRSSGGSAVPHAPGIVNASLFHSTDRTAIEAGYQPLLTVLRDAFAKLGMEIDVGGVAGAFCEGKYDVRSGGAKIAGTAAAARRRNGCTYWLAHASIMAACDVASLVGAVGRFERLLGLSNVYRLAAHTTIETVQRDRTRTARTPLQETMRWQADQASSSPSIPT